nr:circularly permuted type 2 ATP-grasp protein [Haloferula luteola]
MLRENGVTYSVYGETTDEPRPWQLDALPWVLGPEDWKTIEAGLIQRAELLDEILTDLYGDRLLVRDGWIPAKLVGAHSGYFSCCRGLKSPTPRQLILAAMDLARGPDGRMWVVNDRTQAPSGSGYVVENRVVMTRTLPRLFHHSGVRRIASFFRTLRETLESFAPADGKGTPRIVILTPGPQNETYYEHAFLASYLGYTLVQGDDLTVRDGHVWLASLGGLEKVDVIIRRVDASFCDPLELREDSQLGVPGLLEAIRLGHVLVVNHPGSGVLENPGLMAFLPGLARHLHGQDLILPSAATWWCGEKSALEKVLSNLDRFVIKSIERAPTFGTVFGSELTKAQRTALKERILAFPEGYVGQEQVTYSTVPCLHEGQIEPRRGVMRGFVTATAQGGYAVMPGGLTRTSASPEAVVVSSQLGGASKDTWIIAPDPEPFVSLYENGADLPPELDARSVPSRAGENLYWTGRYAERSEGTARLLRRTLLALIDGFGEDSSSATRHREILMQGLTGVTNAAPIDPLKDSAAVPDEDEVLSLLCDPARVGSLPHVLRSFRHATFAVRDLWSPDSWRVIDTILSEWAEKPPSPRQRLDNFSEPLDRLIIDLTALLGLNLESMTRDAGWRLLDSGRRIERAHFLIGVLRHFLLTPRPTYEERLVMESVLAANDSLVTYRKRYRTHPRLDLVLELLLLEPNNARSLLYQVNRLSANITALPRQPNAAKLTPERKLLIEIDSRLRLVEIDRLVESRDSTRRRLEIFLDHMSRSLTHLSDVLTLTYFRHAERTRLLRG